MVSSWKAVSLDPITVANQTNDSYWKRIKTEFDERKFTKEYNKVYMDHNQNTLSHR